MGLADKFDRLWPYFSLELLDSRLKPSSDPKKREAVIAKAGKPRWGTLEFKIYYFFFILVVPLMFKAGMDASATTNINYPRIQPLLSPGWMGRPVDNSDNQYKFFRDNILAIAGLVAVHWVLRRLFCDIPSVLTQFKPRISIFRISRLTFDFLFGLLFLYAAHGYNCLRVLLPVLISASFTCIFNKPRPVGESFRSITIGRAATWLFGIGMLFANEQLRRYFFYQLNMKLLFMDYNPGIIHRWDVFFNFTMLRMLSFNLDYFEKLSERAEREKLGKSRDSADLSEETSGSKLETLHSSEQNSEETTTNPKNPTPTTSKLPTDQQPYLDDRSRLTAPLDLSEYSIKHLIAYIGYAPLYLAGPLLTFNDYVYQSQRPPAIPRNFTKWYAARLVWCILLMEFILHHIYVVAISKTKAWIGDSPFEISMIGFFNLNIIWLKLLIPWRTFRLWSLMDGLDTPENMVRCMDNNYSAKSFWRAWHRSFNRWIVRYIYVPLGGAKRPVLNSLAVFTFVAIWHDIELKLLLWGWLVVLFIIPEIAAGYIFPASKYVGREELYRHLCAIGAVGNIWMMMLANLVGFCLGIDGVKELLVRMFTTAGGLRFAFMSSGCLFIGVQVMFELRESEKRRGIDIRC